MRIEPGQRWVSIDDPQRSLVIGGSVDGGGDDDWEVTLLPAGATMLKTGAEILAGYTLHLPG